MWTIPALQQREEFSRSAARSPALASPTPTHTPEGRTFMRQMLIAAAIAGGLVALWAALLPLAA